MAAAHYRRYIPLFPAAIEQFDLDDYDLVISSSHCVAKSIVKSGRAKHLCYCHTPMRYAWDQFDDYFGPARVGAVRSRLYQLLFGRLARWGRRHGRPGRPICGELVQCCGPDSPIL